MWNLIRGITCTVLYLGLFLANPTYSMESEHPDSPQGRTVWIARAMFLTPSGRDLELADFISNADGRPSPRLRASNPEYAQGTTTAHLSAIDHLTAAAQENNEQPVIVKNSNRFGSCLYNAGKACVDAFYGDGCLDATCFTLSTLGAAGASAFLTALVIGMKNCPLATYYTFFH